jgi:predicted phosphohydrolase
MALYAIGDTHLSLGADKPMDIFGGGWEGYVDKLAQGFQAVSAADTVVLCGDISWGMSRDEAGRAFAFLNALPGRKLLLKAITIIGGQRRQDGAFFCRAWIPHLSHPP